jgi:hypothetical protein
VAPEKAGQASNARPWESIEKGVWHDDYPRQNHGDNYGAESRGDLTAYPDSSFIVFLYLQQHSSAKAIAFMERYGKGLPFTPCHRLEVRNAIRLAVFHGAIDAGRAKRQLKQIDTDLKEQALLMHTRIDWTEILREAEKLGASHSKPSAVAARTSFLAAARHTGCDTFLTFDVKQAAMALAAAMKVTS